ncbi:hypothetical protein [Stenotrophomonas sp. JAG2]|uniref:hypothetical protein n=1 Tax=Stenotrophomonas sp. JAG2 TaxID=3229243 RepID=UPI0034E2216A
MKPLFPTLLLSLLPLGVSAATPPTHAQIEAAIMAMIEAEKKPAASAQDLVLQSMFTPRGFDHGPCFASTTVTGAYECLVGMEIGLKNRYRMLRFVPQGLGWAMQRADVDAPVPPRERVRELLIEQLDHRAAAIDDAAAREELRAFQQGLQILAIEDCELHSMQAPEIRCDVTAGDGTERGTDPQTYVFDAQGEWQNAAPEDRR